MSVETEFESTIENVQKAYKGLTNLGATIPQNKNIENMEDCLLEIYDNYPKTSYGEGTEVTLENCNKGKLDFEDDKVGYGQISQESTTGKNLFHLNDTNKTSYGINQIIYGSEVTLNGTTSSANVNVYLDKTNYVRLTSGTYKVSGLVLSGSYTFGNGDVAISLRKVSNESVVLNLYKGNSFTNNATLTIEEDTDLYLQIFTNATNNVFNNFKIGFQVEQGSSVTSYEQYTGGYASPSPNWEQPISSVTGNQEVVVRGINLLDKTQVVGNNTATTVTQINTGFRVSAETLGYAGVITIDVKANTNYFLKFNTNVIVDSGTQKYVRIFAGTTQTTTIATYTFTEGGGTFNTGNNTKINIWFYCSLGGSGTVDYTNVQLEEGSTASPFEPYVTPITKQISLGNIELCKIGTYRDYIYKSGDKWYVHKEIGKIIYTGANSENWELERINDYGIANLRLVITDYQSNTDNLSYVNYFSPQTTGIAGTQNEGYLLNNQKYFYVRIKSSTAGSVAEFKTWLSTHNTEVRYVLATSTNTEITDTTLINQLEAWYNAQSIKGTTIIESNGDLPLIIKVRALKGA